MPAADTGDRPLLVYDGDCAFCQYWVDYWQALTGPAVRYAPYQSVAGAFPDIAAEDFAAAIYLIDGQGRRYRGAEAAMRVLATVPGKRLGLWCYRRLPGFAALAEAAYRGIAAHRGLAMRLARALWGRRHRPESHVLTRAVGVRAGTEPDLAELTPVPGDVFAMCSDGLTNHLRDEEIAEALSVTDDLEAATDGLIETANERGGEDNTTVVLVRYEKDETPAV